MPAQAGVLNLLTMRNARPDDTASFSLRGTPAAMPQIRWGGGDLTNNVRPRRQSLLMQVDGFGTVTL